MIKVDDMIMICFPENDVEQQLFNLFIRNIL
jgi:hypothetical protein